MRCLLQREKLGVVCLLSIVGHHIRSMVYSEIVFQPLLATLMYFSSQPLFKLFSEKILPCSVVDPICLWEEVN